MKDPRIGNLDRVQIIKGYLNEKGEAEERIYDVAVSDGRKINKKRRCTTPVGNTVDLQTGEFSNTIGTPQLSTVWTDQHFDSN